MRTSVRLAIDHAAELDIAAKYWSPVGSRAGLPFSPKKLRTLTANTYILS